MQPARLTRILESIRKSSYDGLRSEFVASVADVEERNVFDDERTNALREIRQLIAIELQSERVDEADA